MNITIEQVNINGKVAFLRISPQHGFDPRSIRNLKIPGVPKNTPIIMAESMEVVTEEMLGELIDAISKAGFDKEGKEI